MSITSSSRRSVARALGRTGTSHSNHVVLFRLTAHNFIGGERGTWNLLYSHLYAIYCLLQREIHEGTLDPSPDDPVPSPPSSPTSNTSSTDKPKPKPTMPAIFTDPGYSLLSTSILSTSNCGNPALRLFGFGPVAADGYGIGYIIKEEGISVYVS